MHLQQGLTRRDGLLILMGASVVYVFASLVHYGTSFPFLNINNSPLSVSPSITFPASSNAYTDLGASERIPETSLIAHAPGWTLFRNLYMSNGTLFIVSSDPESMGFPQIRMMMSTGLIAENTPENIRMREPTDQVMQIITPEHATEKWGGSPANNQRNRVWSIEGNTLLVNEPWQFLNHYYHFVAELLLGTWAFFYGAFNPSAGLVDMSEDFGQVSSSFDLLPATYQPPSLSRVIFLHASSTEWRDKPGFNSYFIRAAFPSLDIEVSYDWDDRAAASFVPSSNASAFRDNSGRPLEKAWHFPVALLSDRSAAFRGEACSSRTQRIAAEAWEFMLQKGGIDVFGRWWNDVREAVLGFAGVEIAESNILVQPSIEGEDINDSQSLVPVPKQITITYINRQGVRRHLIPEHHEDLVTELQELVRRKSIEEGKDWVLKIIKPELLSKDEQVKLASETTIMLGVHGNGLTHLVLMAPNRYSSVIEIFYPGGFARDYEWTTRALGMRHFTVWNDTYFTHPNEPPLGYPDGFQGTSIPVHGATVAKLIEDRLEERLQY